MFFSNQRGHSLQGPGEGIPKPKVLANAPFAHCTMALRLGATSLRWASFVGAMSPNSYDALALSTSSMIDKTNKKTGFYFAIFRNWPFACLHTFIPVDH